MNFDLRDPIPILNRIDLDGFAYEFVTNLRLSKSASLGVKMCSHDSGETISYLLKYDCQKQLFYYSVSDMLAKVCKKFNMLSGEKLQAFERELSVTQQEVFYRKINDDEKPMEIYFLWRINGERKSIAISDHDPNSKRYLSYTLEELEERLRLLNEEELEKIHQIHLDNQAKKNFINMLIEEKTIPAE